MLFQESDGNGSIGMLSDAISIPIARRSYSFIIVTQTTILYVKQIGIIKPIRQCSKEGRVMPIFFFKSGKMYNVLKYTKIFMFSSSTTWDRSTTHSKFDSTGVRTHDLQIMTVHFMSLRLKYLASLVPYQTYGLAKT